ncbi:MAG TPA: HNH endonuclease [Pirellulaceae bacterium]
MSLSSFFEKTLNAKLANTRWSWDAVDATTARVFLRVWDDEIYPDETGKRVQVLRKHPTHSSPGYGERLKQLDLIRKGATSFGIICKATGPRTIGARNIATFDNTQLLRFGKISEDADFVYAQILAYIPIEQLTKPTTSNEHLAADLAAIITDKSIGTTTKKALVDARVGQGGFRVAVLRLWDNCCSVTGAMTQAAIRASHIKPWSRSTNEERLDPHNGLPLVANLDALFDAGLISFTVSGRMRISSKLLQPEQRILGAQDRSLAKKPSKATAAYLAYHQVAIFQK